MTTTSPEPESEERAIEPPPPAGIVVTPAMLWAGTSIAAVAAGSLGPWVTLGALQFNGIRGDGVITLVAGLLGLIPLSVARARPIAPVFAAIALGVGLFDLAALLAFDGGGIFSIGIGWGLILVLVGSVSLGIWSVVSLPRLTHRGIAAGLLVVVGIATAIGGAVSDRSDVAGESASKSQDTDTDLFDSDSDTPEASPTPEPTQVVASSPVAVGQGIRLAGEDGLLVRATVTRVLDPLPVGDYDEPDAGQRYVGIQLGLTNVGTVSYDDSPGNGAKLLYGDSIQADSTLVSGGPCTGFSGSLKIAPGARRNGCIAFEVPARNTVKTFQLTLNSGFADQTGEWDVRSAPPGAAASGDDESRSSSSGTALAKHCDQNISASSATSCDFAANVFKAYAASLADGGAASETVTAYSAGLGSDLPMDCSYDGSDVECTGGSGAAVRFPKWAADVY